MAFHRRLSWEQLQKAGLALVPGEFRVVRRPLKWSLATHPVGAAVPDSVPKHRLRQLYWMRLIEAAGNPSPVKHRMQTQPVAKAAETREPAPVMATVDPVVPIQIDGDMLPVIMPIEVETETEAIAEVPQSRPQKSKSKSKSHSTVSTRKGAR